MPLAEMGEGWVGAAPAGQSGVKSGHIQSKWSGLTPKRKEDLLFIQTFIYSQLFIECLLQFSQLQRHQNVTGEENKLALVFRAILNGTSY